mgnify:CR=1 FL=1
MGLEFPNPNEVQRRLSGLETETRPPIGDAVEHVHWQLPVNAAVEEHGDLRRELVVSQPQHEPHGCSWERLEFDAGIATLHTWNQTKETALTLPCSRLLPALGLQG